MRLVCLPLESSCLPCGDGAWSGTAAVSLSDGGAEAGLVDGVGFCWESSRALDWSTPGKINGAPVYVSCAGGRVRSVLPCACVDIPEVRATLKMKTRRRWECAGIAYSPMVSPRRLAVPTFIFANDVILAALEMSFIDLPLWTVY